MAGWGSIALTTRIGKCPDPLFFHSWTCAVSQCLRHGDCILPPAIELTHHFAASMLAEQFLTQTNCDTILMIDDDMVFSVEEFQTLRHNKQHDDFGIVSPIYCSRKAGFPPIVLLPTENLREFRPYRPKPGDSMIDVGGVGLGFTWIRRSVFQSIIDAGGKQPFFDFRDDRLGEDFSFCIKARALGIRVGIDCGVSIGHRVTVEARYNLEAQQTEQSAFTNQPFIDLISKMTKQNEEEKRKG